MVPSDPKRSSNGDWLYDDQKRWDFTRTTSRGSIEVADHFQLHAMKMEGDVAKMNELHDIEIKPGQRVEFKPGGSHVMFVGLKHQLAKGEHIKAPLSSSTQERCRSSTASKELARNTWRECSTKHDRNLHDQLFKMRS